MEVPRARNLRTNDLVVVLESHLLEQDISENHGSVDQTTDRGQRALELGN